MLKYWLKNRFIFSFITIFILGICSVCLFDKPYIETKSENLLMTSVYESSNIDFDIPSPTKEQLNQIKNLEFIDDVFGYYYTESEVKIRNSSKKIKIIFSDMLDSLDFTMYNNSRLIESSNNYSNPIYIDYDFSKKNNIKLGDEIEFNNIKFQAGRIYETNTYYTSALFAPLVGEQKKLIENSAKSYSGAYLKCNDKNKTDAYLKTYKPLGRLKNRSDFSNDDEYQMHYNSWKNANYYNEITSFSDKLESINEKTSINYIDAIILSSCLMILLNIVLSFRKCEKRFFSKKQEKNDIKIYYIISITFDFIFLITMMITSAIISFMFVKNYIPSTILNNMIINSLIGCLCVLVIDIIYNVFFQKKLIK